MPEKRNYAFDNLKSVLIFCVVLGHLLEIAQFGVNGENIRKFLYFAIYSFHMPVFLFLSGYYGKFSWKRIIQLTLLYVIFQTAYILFCRHVLCDAIPLQFHTPYWLMWYLLCLIYYCLMIPLLNRIPNSGRWVMVVFSIILSLAAGCCDWIGYPLSLSRFFTYMPYFVIGYYAGKEKQHMQKVCKDRQQLWIFFGTAALLMTVLGFGSGKITNPMQYGSYPYSIGYHAGIRFFLLILGVLWIGALVTFFLTLLNYKIPVLSVVGQNTISVFVLHGFAVRWIGRNLQITKWLSLLLCAVGLVLILGNPWVDFLFGKHVKNQDLCRKI